jgi:hypothetical protein
MAKVTFTEIPETTDKTLCERLKRKAISDITPLVCPNDKEAFAHVSIGARWFFYHKLYFFPREPLKLKVVPNLDF